MAISTYSDLKASITAWTHRSDLTSYLDDFILLCEARMNRELQVSQQETILSSVGTSQYITLPTDYLALRKISITANPVCEIKYITPVEMDILDTNSGILQFYTIVGDQIKLNTASDYDVEIVYYAKIPALSSGNTTNWVIDSHPEAYLYGCLAEAFKFIQNNEEAASYIALFNQVLQQIKHLDSGRKYGNSMRVRVA